MIKYYIVPNDSPIETVNANSPDEALIAFASSFPVDLGKYFRAVTESEYEDIMLQQDIDGDRNLFIRFAKEVLEEDFEVPADDLDEIADTAFEYYCDGVGTEYEAIQGAADDYWEKENN